MRVGLVADPSSPHTLLWIKGLAGRGHDLFLFSPYKGAVPTDLPAHMTAPLTGSPSRARPGTPSGGKHQDMWKLRTITRAIRLLPPIRRWLARVEIDRLVSLRLMPEGYLAAFSGFRPYAVVSWGQDVLRMARGHALHRIVAGRALRRASLLVGETDAVTACMQELGGRAGSILKGWTGIDLEFWSLPPAGDLSEVRVRLERAYPDWRPWLEGKRAGAKIILSPRPVARNGHQWEMVKAFAAVKQAGAWLLMAGRGDSAERARCHRLAQELGMGNRFHDLGVLSHEELRRVFWMSDAALSLWAPDGLSQSLLQIMATGVFPVAADIPGNREWIEAGRNGLLVDPEDPDSIADAVHRVLTDADLRREARGTNREIVESRANLDVNMEKLVQAILEMKDSRS